MTEIEEKLDAYDAMPERKSSAADVAAEPAYCLNGTVELASSLNVRAWQVRERVFSALDRVG
jgi:hypothetical protein